MKTILGLLAAGLLVGLVIWPGWLTGGRPFWQFGQVSSRDRVSTLIGDLKNDASEARIKEAVRNEVSDQTEANRIVDAILDARSRGVAMRDISRAIDDLGSNADLRHIRNAIEDTKPATAAAPPTATPPPAGQVPPGTSSVTPGQGQSNSGGNTTSGAGQAPQNVNDAARVLGVDGVQFLTVLYPRPGDATAIGWVLGTSASESAGTRLTARTVPAGVTVDYDPGASTLSGPISISEKLTDKWTRATLSGQGSFTGLKATFYWTPGVYSSAVTSGPTTSGVAASSSSQQACSAVDPGPILGGSWTFKAVNQWALNGSATIKGAQGWVVHTPKFSGDPGLPSGQTETTSVATAYNQNCRQ